MKLFKLSKDGQKKYIGTENSCYYKLQKSQSQSSDWAIKFEGWTIEKVEPNENWSKYWALVLNSWLSFEDYEQANLETPKQKIDFLFNEFNKTHDFLIKRIGAQRALSEYLQGLPNTINGLEFETDEILTRAHNLGLIKGKHSQTIEKNEQKYLEGYFEFLAWQLMKMNKKPLENWETI